MATFATGLLGAVYVDSTLINFVTNITVNIERDSAEEAVMNQQYKIKRVGAYGGEFSGSALVDLDSKQLFDQVTGQSTATNVLSIYPVSSDLTDYWYGDAQFNSWSAEASPADLWSGDFGGVFTGEIFAVGFS
jgi:hypothetical protein